jgi:hypothetical protein
VVLDTKAAQWSASRSKISLPFMQRKAPAARWTILFSLIALTGLAMLSAPAQAQTADPINGGVTLVGNAKCPNEGVGNSSCYNLSIQCSGIDGSGVAAEPVELKVTNPGAANGAILFISPGGGNGFFDESFNYGDLIINSVVQAGFTAVQPSFGEDNGWLTGPAPDGARALSCRYAALANWVFSGTSPLIHQSGTAMCAAGVSGGSSAVVYGLAHFGMGTSSSRIFDMVEVISGPTFGRIDHGCICNQPPFQTLTGQGQLSDCYLTIGSLIDDTYSAPYCSQAHATHSTTNQQLLQHDSIMSDDLPFLNYQTVVRVVYGAQNDEGAALPQGQEWLGQVTSPVTTTVVPDAAHLVPDTFDGAMQIANDLNSACVLLNSKRKK